MDPADYSPTLPDPTGHLDHDDWSSYKDHQAIDTTDYDYEDILPKVAIPLCSIISILGIIGNGLVIWIAGFRMKKSVSAMWFLHLAIADVLCCVSLFLRITQWTSLSRFPSADIIYISLEVLLLMTTSASVLLLTAMSIDRWVSVMWPFWTKVHRTHKLVGITAGIIWVLSPIWAGIMFYLLAFYGDFNVGFHTALTIRLICFLIMFVIPFLIIVISYVTIFLKIRKSNRPQRSQRPYRVITAVILCFFIFWAPYYILPLLPMYYEIKFDIEIYIIIILCHLNRCINPIMYVFMGQDSSHGLLRSIPFRIESALSEHPDDQSQEQNNLEPTSNANILQVDDQGRLQVSVGLWAAES